MPAEVQCLKYSCRKEDEEWKDVKINGFEKSPIILSIDNLDGTWDSKKNDIKHELERKKRKDEEPKPLSFLSLFQFATCKEKILTIIGCVVAIICGTAYPYVIVLVGNLVDLFVDLESNRFLKPYIRNETQDSLTTVTSNSNALTPTTITTAFLGSNSTVSNFSGSKNEVDSAFLEECLQLATIASLISLGLLIGNYIMVVCLTVAAEGQTFRIKCMFMRAVLRQDISWFDTNQTGDFSSKITLDLNRFRDGVGERIAICTYFVSTSFISVGCALYYGWKLTLVIMSIVPIIVAAMAVTSKIQANLTISESSAYGKAGAIAEEVFSSIRTVVAFGGEEKEMERYGRNLHYAKRSGIKRGLATAVGGAILWICMFCSYSIAIWYGVERILESREKETKEYLAGSLLIVFFNVLQTAIYIGQATPYFESFSMARGAAMNIFYIIKRIPPIDSNSNDGKKPSDLVGNIELREVHFQYPARPEVKVLNGISLTAKAGETVALVGSSGCGKSTIIQLIQRFYDPMTGEVLLDGQNIKELNVGWLREHIGVVGQEPVLFATSIKENIRHGYPQASDMDIKQASVSANAHDFICKLPMQYDTIVGERGAQLSGGQKQRIAIARALVRNPKILLLDEATSALDTESESIVQAALDQAREGRTTFIVAHRLSTIRNADKIIVLDKGAVAEIGHHTELMNKKGLYYQLVVSQIDDSEPLKQKFQIQNGFNRQISTISSGSVTSKDKIPNGVSNYDEIDEPEEEEMPSRKRLLKYGVKEWPCLLTGVISAVVMGTIIPIYGIIFGDFIYILAEPDDEKIKSDSFWYSMVFLILAAAAGTAQFLQIFMFSIAGERLTKRLRRDVFSVMVRQHIGWFDDPQNGTGVLCSRLSSDAAQVQGATGSRLATVSQAMSTLVAATVVGLYFNWKIGIVILSFVPLILIATYLETRVVSGHLLQEKKATEGATKIAVEAIEHIRTVVSLHQESTFFRKYEETLQSSQGSLKKRCHIRGLTFGFAQAIPSLAYGIGMYYGSYLILNEGMKFGDLFKVTEGVIFGSMMMGEAVSFAPNYQKAKAATIRIFKLLDMRSKIDSLVSSGLKMPPITGQIKLENVRFSYPMRSESKVLNDINLLAEPGQTVALVGSSGCGKSTCVQLLERFYDTQGGEVLIDGMNVKNLNVSWLRSQIGLVSQEPVLFGYSIAENIAYGDNKRQVPMAEIIEAARKANIHEFICNLPAGYDTRLGDHGTQLSGGQKQRIAIARALVRNPSILLLDEATSALDTESEKIVQETLDRARVGRTSIVIAHRLSTIRNADKILVIHKGQVREEGRHNELLQKQGLYYKLYTIQAGP